MKQPELGKVISELRINKGLTQEELVNKCNISVRTLQRIESGEVMPRSYTIKTILSALEYDFSKITEYEDNKFNAFLRQLKKLMLIDFDTYKSSDHAKNQLNIAWVFGILYLVFFFFLGAMEHLRFIEEWMKFSTKQPPNYFRIVKDNVEFSNIIYVIIKLLALVVFVYFQRGFILIGEFYKNSLLKIISFILIYFTILMTGYDIVSLFYESFERPFILGGNAFAFGIIGIIYGVSLKRLQNSVGKIAKYASVLEIIAGCFFLTIVLSFLNLAIYIPAKILEIIIIYKIIEIIKTKQKENNIAQL